MDLSTIRQKVDANERLTAEDGLFLFSEEADIHALGRLADTVRRRRHGDVVYYNINMHLNPTNVCQGECPLCAYSRTDMDAPGAFTLSEEQALARAALAEHSGCTELHIVSGIHPEKPFAWYRDILRVIHDAHPTLHLKAFTAAEIAHFATIESRSVCDILQQLIDVGLGSLPGGGAEIFDPDVRRQICPNKIDADTWLDVHRTAHQLGLRSNATVLFGHVETAAHRVDHLLRLRELQDETGGLQAFVPLAFHPENTALEHLRRAPAILSLRVIAAARLLLDNIDHIKAYWISLGLGPAQMALGYGANDLDGTVLGEKIHHEAGAAVPHALSVKEIRHLIEEAGRTAVQRDTLYRPVG